MKDDFHCEFEDFGDLLRFSLFSVVGLFVVIFSELFEKSKSLVK